MSRLRMMPPAAELSVYKKLWMSTTLGSAATSTWQTDACHIPWFAALAAEVDEARKLQGAAHRRAPRQQGLLHGPLHDADCVDATYLLRLK